MYEVHINTTSSMMFYSFELLTPIILLCCRSNSEKSLTSKATESEIEDELKLRLHGAPDRNGGRSARAKKQLKRRRESYLLILLKTVFFDHVHLAETEIAALVHPAVTEVVALFPCGRGSNRRSFI
jgi:hypothetical protein